MNEEKFRKKMKKIITFAIISIIGIIAIVIYMFCTPKAELSINTSSDEVSLEKEGIREEEFYKYLSIFSLLVNEEYEDIYSLEDISNIRILDSAIAFVDIMCKYDPTISETGLYEYEADMVNKIIQEINGINIEESLITGNKYTYDNEKNTYCVSEMTELDFCNILEIQEFNKKDNKINVTYTCNLGNNENVYKISAILVENLECDYSKYFVNTIEKVSQ